MPPPVPPELRHAKLLIVDNQEDNVALLEQTLRGAGYAAVTATTDPATVAELHRANRYDLILLDLQMPGTDGFAVMAALRALAPGSEELPVLVITAQPEQRQRALEAGAKDFLSKPFELREVLTRVRSLLALSRLEGGNALAASSGDDPAPPGSATQESAAPGSILPGGIPPGEVLAGPPPARAPGPSAPPVAASVPAFSVPRTLLWILGALAGLWLIYRLWAVWLLLIAALVFAGALHPVVVAAEAHGFKRRKALALVITVLTVGGALLTFFTVPPLIVQFETIVHDLPGQRLRLIAELDQHPLTLPLGRALNAIQLTEQTGRLRALLIGHTTDAAVVVGYALTMLFLSLYFLTDGKRTQGVLYAIVPRTHHMRLARIIYNLRTIVGGYVRGQILTSVAFGALTLLLLEICRVPNALPFALLASVLDVIPTIGGLLAAGPTFLAALSQGPKTALIVLVVMLGYQLFANKVLVPAVYGRALRLSPVTVTLAMIAGGILFGVMGALFALPLAAALQMIPRELGFEMPGDDSDDSVARTRDEKTEAAYELMSSGSTAPDAGQIANELAHGLREADAWVAASDARKKGETTQPGG